MRLKQEGLSPTDVKDAPNLVLLVVLEVKTFGYGRFLGLIIRKNCTEESPGGCSNKVSVPSTEI
jgi:hypothetical protein